MVSALLHPLNIYILGLGGGFLIPLLYQLAKSWLPAVFFSALCGITLITGIHFVAAAGGAPAIDVFTAGIAPPVSINLRLGLAEGFFTFSINSVCLLGAAHLWPRLREHYGALLLYLIGVMGLNGMVMTRDLFNLFVFLEIVSIATYGLLGLVGTASSLAAAFKYIIATVIASTFFLLATALLYFVTGTLNIDELIQHPEAFTGLIALTALLLLLAALMVELKPFPANGWGLDVYETAPGGIAAFVSVGVSAGVFFSLYKLLPLFAPWLDLIAFSGGLTFVASNLIGLRQIRVQRMLGYSSVGQMGLATLALALLAKAGAEEIIPLVVGGIYLNHLLAKAGLFWLADLMKIQSITKWSPIARNRLLLVAFAALVIAISGLPPFPGFWAKWALIMQLSATDYYWTIAAILIGSLLEAAYMFRWLGRSLHAQTNDQFPPINKRALLPVIAAALLLLASGGVAAYLSAPQSLWLFMPLFVGGVLALIEAQWRNSLPGSAKAMMALASVIVFGPWLLPANFGIGYLFGVIFIVGGFVVGLGALYRSDRRNGYYPLLATMLLALPSLTRATTSLEFFVCWEIITLSSYFLIANGRHAGSQILRYLLFSLGSAFFILAGFGQLHTLGASGDLIAALRTLGPQADVAFVLLAIGCLIKAGALGVHVWIPGTYALADDDLTALLSAVISKVAIFGLLTGTYLAIRSELGLELAHSMAWIGFMTTLVCSVLALFQQDVKRLLAYSSISQLGYIIAAVALMSHIGWVTALYLVANHLLVKGVLFLAIAGVILRAQANTFNSLGGLIENMPWTCTCMVIALVAMSGLPPLAGFGSKWLLIGTMLDNGWYGLGTVGFLATFVGFLYMIRLAHSVFWGKRHAEHINVREAPATLLAPQFLLITGIAVLAFYPKILMEPLSRAIDPTFAATLVWEGQSLEDIYNTLNPFPVMSAAIIISLTLFGLLVLFNIYRHKIDKLQGASSFEGMISSFRHLFEYLPTLDASAFWTKVAVANLQLSGFVRQLYTGNGQTYAAHVLAFIIAIYLIGRAQLM